jgi:hypothetical protein
VLRFNERLNCRYPSRVSGDFAMVLIILEQGLPSFLRFSSRFNVNPLAVSN